MQPVATKRAIGFFHISHRCLDTNVPCVKRPVCEPRTTHFASTKNVNPSRQQIQETQKVGRGRIDSPPPTLNVACDLPNNLQKQQSNISTPSLLRPEKGKQHFYLAVPVVDQLDGPAALVFDPHEDDSRDVARRQLLVRLVPFHEHHLRRHQERHDNKTCGMSSPSESFKQSRQSVIVASRFHSSPRHDTKCASHVSF